jgi:ubiquinone/menaquinone biosynthesis C-methylase UbiE
MEVVDLCSGDGWFTLQIVKFARHVTSIDIDRIFLDLASVRLAQNGIENCKFVEGNAYDIDRLMSQPAEFVFMANAFHGVPGGAGAICDCELACAAARGDNDFRRAARTRNGT